jgi:flagellar basal-body rod protein FlgB
MQPSRLDKEVDFHAQTLKLRGYRQQLLASNIANADTPNYKAVDIDFEQELKRITSRRSDVLSLQTTQKNHLQAQSGNGLGAHVQYRTDIQPNIDGNTVNLDVERAKLAENAFRYENTVRTISGQFRTLLTAIRG